MTSGVLTETKTDTVAALPSLRPLLVPLSGLLAAQFIASLSGNVVATSLPTLMAELDGPDSHTSWLVAATILTQSATTPIWGKLGDRVNPKRVLIAAMCIYVLGTIGAIVSLNTTMLIVMRAIQGLGLGGILTSVAIVVASLVVARQRGRVNSWASASMTTAQLAAPVLGGILATAPLLGWRWSFIGIFVVAVIALTVIVFTLRVPERASRVHPTLDYSGAALIGATVTGLLLTVTTAGDRGWGDPLVLITAPLTVGLAVATIFVERRAVDPIIPFALLRHRVPALAMLGAFCAGTAIFVGSVFTSEFLQMSLQLSPAISGTMLIPMALSTALAAWLAGRYMSRTGRIKPVLVTGFLSLSAGLSTLAMIQLAPYVCAIAGTVLVASGLGMLMQNLILSAQNSVDHAHVGTITATILTVFMLGGTIALVCSGSLLNALVHTAEQSGATVAAAYGASIPWIFVPILGAVLIGLVTAAAMPRTKLRSTL